jgi:hypothetical protein
VAEVGVVGQRRARQRGVERVEVQAGRQGAVQLGDYDAVVWISGEANEDSILKFTRDGKLVWDFEHRPPPEAAKMPENNQETRYIINKGRFQLDGWPTSSTSSTRSA